MTTPMHAAETVPENVVAPPDLQQKRLTTAQRWLSLAELALGSAIVIGHNVYHVIPNEVPILFVLGLLSLRLRGGSWAATGLRWPSSWPRTAVLAVAAATLRILLGALVIRPLTAHFWPAPAAPTGSDEIQGHALVALEWLLLGLDLCRLRRRDRIPRLSAHARGGSRRPVPTRMVGRHLCVSSALRIWPLLQGSVRSSGLRYCGPHSCRSLCLVETQPVGVGLGPWLH